MAPPETHPSPISLTRPETPGRMWQRSESSRKASKAYLVPLLLALFGLVAAACGGGAATDDPAVTAAAEVQGSLENTGDLRTIEVLDVATGEATTLADTVTGDRAVLLWFYAPH